MGKNNFIAFHNCLIAFCRYRAAMREFSILPPEAMRRGLAPRLDQVFLYLSNGFSEKQVAFALELSLCTIHGYVKQIYDRFEVESRPELFVKLILAIYAEQRAGVTGPDGGDDTRRTICDHSPTDGATAA